MDDAQAIRRLKRGDLGGLEILMQRYQVKAARTAFLITHDESIAQDVLQETFIRICQRIRQFTGNGARAGCRARHRQMVIERSS